MGWSQQELADRCGVSRTEISAIETGRVVPSIATALALAQGFDCRVEDLFGLRASQPGTSTRSWSSGGTGLFWRVRVGGRLLNVPHERTLAGEIAPDNLLPEESGGKVPAADPDKTLVIAGCDPAVALLVSHLRSVGNFRVISLSRSSRMAMELLKEGRVHAAGLHFSSGGKRDENLAEARALPGRKFRLVRVVRWESGVALDSSLKIDTVRSALASHLRWVGREEGSGARQCLDEIFGRRRKPEGYQYCATDHLGVAATVRSGWAQAGVCVRLPAEESGLRFLKVREENYDICFAAGEEADPRIRALLKAIQSSSYRKDLASLPGYHTETTGEVRS